MVSGAHGPPVTASESGVTFAAATSVPVAPMVTVPPVTAPPLYASVTLVPGAAIDVAESVVDPDVSLSVSVTGDAKGALPTIVLPSLSSALTAIARVELVPRTSAFDGADRTTFATVPPIATVTENGAPATVAVVEPVPSTLPVAFAAS